jgi:hypothetical protein
LLTNSELASVDLPSSDIGLSLVWLYELGIITLVTSSAGVGVGLRRGDNAKSIYVVYAYAVLPMIVLVGPHLIEPSRRHPRWVRPFRRARVWP